jgi:DNA-binding NarL/FixJ family response regulator
LPEKRYKIVVVEDHPIVRHGLVMLIDQEPDLHVCGEAEDVNGAMALTAQQQPDLVVVDISLKGSNGLDLIKSIKGDDPNRKILVVSMHDEAIYAERSIRAGAQGYIMKQEAVDKIIGAIRRILRGELYLSDSISASLLFKVTHKNAEHHPATLDQLTDRELEVFQLIGQGFATREIADHLNLSIKTIETYRANLKQKLGVKNAPQLVQRAVQFFQQKSNLF